MALLDAKTSMRRRLFIAASVGLLALGVWSMIWPILVTHYARGLVAIAHPLVRASSTDLWVEADTITVYDYKGTAIAQRRLSNLNEFGLLLGLFLVVPLMTLTQRMWRLALACALQVLVHLVSLLLLVWIAYEFYFGINKQSFAYWLLNLIMAGNLIFPILIWALLTFRYWFPKPADTVSASTSQKKRCAEKSHP